MVERLGRKATDPDYGMGQATIDCDRLGLVEEQELTERLVSTFESPDYRPPRLPAVATELLALSQNPDVEFSDIEALLEQDAMLAGEVLSVARSVFYSGTRQVTSLRGALVRLGVTKLRQVVMQAATNMRVFRSAAYRGSMEQLRRHCRATAHLAQIVSEQSSKAAEQAFLCGLLHDVGIAGILLVLGDVKRGKQPPDLTPLWPAIDGAHAKAGARMVVLWGLPPEIAMAVGAHHQVRIGADFDHPVAATVCLAEALANELGLGLAPRRDAESEPSSPDLAGLLLHDGIDKSDAVTLGRARDALGLDDAGFERLRSAAEAWAAQVNHDD